MNQIIRRTIKHCTKLLLGSRCSSLPFHNVAHTLEVFENVSKIGTYENIAFEELEPILLAALFHDTGNAKVFKGHEDFSIAEAITFLMSKKYPIDKIILVVDCIKATRLPQKPNDRYEEIICDADLFHLGTRSYILKNKLLRREWAMFLNIEYSNAIWSRLNIEFLQEHKFHTNYGKEVLEFGKQENIEKLKIQFNKWEEV